MIWAYFLVGVAIAVTPWIHAAPRTVEEWCGFVICGSAGGTILLLFYTWVRTTQ